MELTSTKLLFILSSFVCLASLGACSGDQLYFDCQQSWDPPASELIESDSADMTAEATCGDEACGHRAVLRGLPLSFSIETTRHDLPSDVRIESSAPEILKLRDQGWEDQCGDLVASAEGMFNEVGDVAIVVKDDGEEEARFTYHVREAASLELAVRLADGGPATVTTDVEVGPGTSLFVQAIVKSADGERLATGQEVSLSLEDEQDAYFNEIHEYDEVTGYGGAEWELVPKSRRPARVLAQLGDLTATLDVTVSQ